MVRTHPTVATIRSEPLQPSNRRDGLQTAIGGAVWIRIAERVCSQPIPDSKRTRPGREPEPEPRPGPEPSPAPAPGRPAGRRRQRRRARACAGMVPSQSRAKTPSTQRARPLGTWSFLYLNTTNFHPMANVGLNAFSLFLVPFWL